MKLLVVSKYRSEGSTLALTILTIALVAVAVASVLRLVCTRSAMMARSQSWNECMPVLEAGIEEALSHGTRNLGNLASAGWTLANGQYTKSATLGQGGYSVRMREIDTIRFEIVSTGKMPAPGREDYVTRSVRITTTIESVFFGGMVLKTFLDLKGNNVYSDSYDSRDPNKSTNGFYDQAKRRDKGGLATIQGLIDSLSVGNTEIYGTVWTSPDGTVAMKANGSVGSLNWHAGGNVGIEPGYWKNDLNFDLPDVVLPQTTWMSPRSATKNDNKALTETSVQTWTEPSDAKNKKNDGKTTVTYTDPVSGFQTNVTTQISTDTKNNTVTTTVTTQTSYTRTYEQVVENGDFTVSQLDKRTLVQGDVRLYVTDRINITGSDFIELAPGATLTIYMGGQVANLGTILHQPNLPPTSFQYYGLPSHTSLEIKGAPDWSGVVYAPSASLKIAGQGAIYGSLVANDATLSGNASIHYDEALEKLYPSPPRGMLIQSWDEL